MHMIGVFFGNEIVSKTIYAGSIPATPAIGKSSKGRTNDFDSLNGGSIPSFPAIPEPHQQGQLFIMARQLGDTARSLR